MDEFQNESPDYKDDFIYSYGNAKQGTNFTFFKDVNWPTLELRSKLFLHYLSC